MYGQSVCEATLRLGIREIKDIQILVNYRGINTRFYD